MGSGAFSPDHAAVIHRCPLCRAAHPFFDGRIGIKGGLPECLRQVGWKPSASSNIPSIVLNRMVLLDDSRENGGAVAVKTDDTFADPGPE